MDASEVNFKLNQSYNPEAVYDNLGSRYFILCIDGFNKNYSNTLSSPFTESVYNNETAIAKVQIIQIVVILMIYFISLLKIILDS